METSILEKQILSLFRTSTLHPPLHCKRPTYLYKMRRKQRSKNCGSCSYPPTQSNYFLGIYFTKLLLMLKRSLQHIFLVIFRWPSNLHLTWKNGSTKIQNPRNSQNRIFIYTDLVPKHLVPVGAPSIITFKP